METNQSLSRALAEIETQGIGVDREQLRKDICRQFPDYRLWIREYIVNAYDAGARCCHISAADEGDVVTVSVQDDGHGMDRRQIEVFMTKFQSCKQDAAAAIGRFGVGSFSVAAIPGQCGFAVSTSTGEETWRFATGSLLEDRPIRVERLREVRPRGTTFDISFRTRNNAFGVLCELSQVAYIACRLLPIQVEFHADGDSVIPDEQIKHWQPESWVNTEGESLPRQFTCRLLNQSYDLVLALGKTAHALYQKRVLITKDLYDHDLLSSNSRNGRSRLPGLVIRVDSSAFEMPLGRHCLSDTTQLNPLRRHICSDVLPQYVRTVIEAYQGNPEQYSGATVRQMEKFLAKYLVYSPNSVAELQKVPLFHCHDRSRISMKELESACQDNGKVYLDKDNSGIDYSVFEAPVLNYDQPYDLLDFLKSVFGTSLVNLTIKDLVQEIPEGKRPKLSKTEERFSAQLGFQPTQDDNFIRTLVNVGLPGGDLAKTLVADLGEEQGQESPKSVSNPIIQLRSIEWRAGHLFSRDGVSPCRSVYFLRSGNEIVLNLHHPEIIQLVELSEQAPLLAAHFAAALCLAEPGKSGMLSDLNQMEREKLINLDAVLRCGRQPSPSKSTPPPSSSPEQEAQQKWNFNINAMDDDDFPF